MHQNAANSIYFIKKTKLDILKNFTGLDTGFIWTSVSDANLVQCQT